SYPDGYDPSGRYEIVLEADTDGDGVPEPLCGTVVQATYDSTHSVAVPRLPAVAHELELSAIPNPFFGGSRIAFTLPVADEIELGVYDLSGRQVRALLHAPLAPGEHRLEWNGRRDSGP